MHKKDNVKPVKKVTKKEPAYIYHDKENKEP